MVALRPQRTLTLLQTTLHNIEVALWEPEKRRLNRLLERINEQNKQIHKTTTDGFLYNGEYEVPKKGSTILPSRGRIPPLDSSLWSEMEDLLCQRRESINNLHFCKQTIFSLIKDCSTLQGIRDALPDHLWMITGFKEQIPRTKPELWTVQNNPKLLEQYKLFEEKIAVFLAGRLMY